MVRWRRQLTPSSLPDRPILMKAGWIEFYCQPPFREIDLNFVRAFFETSANLHLMLAEQIIDEFLARVSWNIFCRIHQAERRRRDDRLL